MIYMSLIKMSIVGFYIYMSGEEKCYLWEPISKLHHYNWIFRKTHCRECTRKQCEICENQSGLCLEFTYEKQV